MKGHLYVWIGAFVIALGVLSNADVALAGGSGSGAGGSSGSGGSGSSPGGTGGTGAPGGTGTGAGAGAPGAPGGAAPGDGSPGESAANTNPVGNWLLPVYAWREPAALGTTVVLTPDGREIVLEDVDGGYPAAFPAAFPAGDPAFRTYYPGICPDIDYRTDTLCYQLQVP